jgi:hypothetical protein
MHNHWLVAECIQELFRASPEYPEENPKAFVGALLIGDAIKGIEIIAKVLTGSK